MVATCIGIEGGWFHTLGKGCGPKTATELAEATGAERLLIGKDGCCVPIDIVV